jgi:hypothetical protein
VPRRPAAHRPPPPLHPFPPYTQGTGDFPVKSLKGFARTRLLAPGESQLVTLPLRTLDFTVPRAEDGVPLVRHGTWRVAAGGLARDIALDTSRLDKAGATTDWPARTPAGR